jgi:hypothetical protein
VRFRLRHLIGPRIDSQHLRFLTSQLKYHSLTLSRPHRKHRTMTYQKNFHRLVRLVASLELQSSAIYSTWFRMNMGGFQIAKTTHVLLTS